MAVSSLIMTDTTGRCESGREPDGRAQKALDRPTPRQRSPRAALRGKHRPLGFVIAVACVLGVCLAKEVAEAPLFGGRGSLPFSTDVSSLVSPVSLPSRIEREPSAGAQPRQGDRVDEDAAWISSATPSREPADAPLDGSRSRQVVFEAAGGAEVGAPGLSPADRPGLLDWSGTSVDRVVRGRSDTGPGPVFVPEAAVPVRNPLRPEHLFKPETVKTGLFLEPVSYAASPEPITLHFDDVDVRKALEMLSREESRSILVAPGVTGRVTANLQGLSFDEALEAILELCNLVALRKGNLIFVYAPKEVPQSGRMLRTYFLDYVSAADVLQAVQGLLSPEGQAFMTQCTSDDNRRTQETIVVEDLPDYVRRVDQYVAEIDQPPRQVLIEAHVLQVDLEDDRKHGVNFEHLFQVMNNGVTLKMQGFANPLASQAFLVNVDGANLTALIECLQTTEDAKTLASPRVLVLNGQAARIQIGQRLGFPVITATETTSMQSVEFLDLGVVLEVTPRISRDGRVLLQVKPKVATGRIDPDTKLPEEETTEVATDVLLTDGQGVVIGGLIQEKDEDVERKIPYFGDLWLVGTLFQWHHAVKTRSEIIITLIPRVLPYQPAYESQHQEQAARAADPLVWGPLRRYPRPFEPRLPDAIHNPRAGRPWCLDGSCRPSREPGFQQDR